MKNKDIIILVIATVVIIGSIFVVLQFLNPAPQKLNENSEADKIRSIPANIDEQTYEKIKILSDYGEPNLDNIGKTDIFSGY